MAWSTTGQKMLYGRRLPRWLWGFLHRAPRWRAMSSTPSRKADLYLLRFILPDWQDADGIRILPNCRRAMRPRSSVVLVEAFLGHCHVHEKSLPDAFPLRKAEEVGRAKIQGLVQAQNPL